MFITFKEFKDTKLRVNTEGWVVQIGPGITGFTHGGNGYIWLEDDKEFKPKLNGCQLVASDSINRLLLVGQDGRGKMWEVNVDDLFPDSCYVTDDNTGRLSRKATAEVLKGRPFAEAIAELVDGAREEELAELREKVARLEKSEKTANLKLVMAHNAIGKIYSHNQTGGPGSRKSVSQIIELLFPEIVKRGKTCVAGS